MEEGSIGLKFDADFKKVIAARLICSDIFHTPPTIKTCIFFFFFCYIGLPPILRTLVLLKNAFAQPMQFYPAIFLSLVVRDSLRFHSTI